MPKRNKQMRFDVTEEEKEIIRKGAEAGDQKMSDFMRKVLLRAAKARLAKEGK